MPRQHLQPSPSYTLLSASNSAVLLPMSNAELGLPRDHISRSITNFFTSLISLITILLFLTSISVGIEALVLTHSVMLDVVIIRRTIRANRSAFAFDRPSVIETHTKPITLLRTSDDGKYDQKSGADGVEVWFRN